MNDSLNRALVAQADRAPADVDAGRMLSDVRRRAAERSRRRRVVIGAGAGASVVAGVVVASVLVAGAVGAGHDRNPAGAGPTAGTSSARSSATTPPPSSVRASTTTAAAPVLPPTGATLVAIAPAPKKAQVSLGLAPKGWHYTSYYEPFTTYGTGRASSHDSEFEKQIAVIVGDRYPMSGPTSFPLHVAGHPAQIVLQTKPAAWTVNILWNAKTIITVQVWPNARLSKAQVLRMSNTLDVRSTKFHAHG